MRASVFIPALALLASCAVDEPEPSTAISTASTGTATAAATETSGTTNANESSDETSDVSDVGDTTPTVCPSSSALSLCLPAANGEAGLCLCSRQAFGTATTVTIGDLDGDGLDDALVHGPGAVTPYQYSTEMSALVALPTPEFPTLGSPQTSFVRTLGLAIFSHVQHDEDHMLMFGTYDLTSGPSDPQSIALTPMDHWAFGDFDGDGAVDLAVATLDAIDLSVSHLSLTVYPDALDELNPVEVLSQIVSNGIDVPSLIMLASDLDRDGHDDLWIHAFADDFPAVLWGAATGGLMIPGTPTGATGGHLVRFVDLAADHAEDLLVQSSGFGDFGLVFQAAPRVFEPGPSIAANPPVEIRGNAIFPVRSGDRHLALALTADEIFAFDDVRDSALGVAIIDGTHQVSDVRTQILKHQTARIVDVIDIDGDGYQEVFVRHSDGSSDALLYLCDIVEG